MKGEEGDTFMSFSADPIRLRPRLLPRRWGRAPAPAWCAGAERPTAPVGEIWLAHPYNTTLSGAHLGALVAQHSQPMLGDLGRAPPTLRLVVTDEPSDAIQSEAPVSLWRVLESPLDAHVDLYDCENGAPKQMRCRRGDLIRVSDASRLIFPAGVTALEVRANFSPNNRPPTERAQRLLAPSEKKHRTSWIRDPALSVEAWTLPEISFIEPDGETCHVLVALTPGVAIEDEPLTRGDAVFVPAEGRRVTLTGKGAQVVVAYPDLVPTQIWKHVHAPKPAALALDPAVLERAHQSFTGDTDARVMRPAA
jgi:hypothetical protein